jgi:hypothetical protein
MAKSREAPKKVKRKGKSSPQRSTRGKVVGTVFDVKAYEPTTMRISRLTENVQTGGIISRDLGQLTLPDKIYVAKEDAIDIKGLTDDQKKDVQVFKNYTYHVIKCPFTFLAKRDVFNSLKSIQLAVKVNGDTDDVQIANIFPKDEVTTIGKATNEYTIKGNFSIELPDLKIPGTDIGIPVDASAELEKKVVKKVEYNLTIPKVQAGTVGDSEGAVWQFFFNEAIPKQGQYRVDMIVGLPKDVPLDENYRLELTFTADAAWGFDPDPIMHDATIVFRDTR